MIREKFYLVLLIVLIFLSLITILLAILMLILLLSKWKSQTRSITNLHTCNSCLTLLYHSLSTILQCPYLYSNRIRTDILCQIHAFLYCSSATTVAYSFFIQAISRYFIMSRSNNKLLQTFYMNYLLIFLTWIISFIISISMLYFPLAYQYENESRFCILSTKVFLSSFLVIMIMFCIPLMIIILLYTSIIRLTIKKNPLTFNSVALVRWKRNMKVFQNILIFTFVLVIGGTPYFLCVIINPIFSIPWLVYPSAIVFVSFGCALNSLALFFRNSQLKTLLQTAINQHR